MKTLIVYASIHHQNTEKVAKVMAEEMGADLVPISQAQPDTLTAYDLIGFGSGVYYVKLHRTLLQYVEALPVLTGKQAFIFSTSGDGKRERHAVLKELLVNRGFSIVGISPAMGWIRGGLSNLSGGRIREDQMRTTWRKHGPLHGD